MSHPSSHRSPASKRTLVATTAALVAGILIGAAVSSLGAPAVASATVAGHGGGHDGSGAVAGGMSGGGYVPACPRPVYSADGNVSPLFCKVDNPVALKFYGRLAPKLFSLSSKATAQQVGNALTTASTVRHATNLELCNAYQLAAWAHGWTFDPDPSLPYCTG